MDQEEKTFWVCRIRAVIQISLINQGNDHKRVQLSKTLRKMLK